jgi:hypothetical protein
MPASNPSSAADAAAQREYVASMSLQLAAMARLNGDEHVAGLLEHAAQAAAGGSAPPRPKADS